VRSVDFIKASRRLAHIVGRESKIREQEQLILALTAREFRRHWLNGVVRGECSVDTAREQPADVDIA